MMKFKLIALACAAVLCGCANLTSTQTETINADGSSTRTTTLRITTLFDAKSKLQDLKSSTTDKVQELTVGSLTESSNGSNVVQVLKEVHGILSLMPK